MALDIYLATKFMNSINILLFFFQVEQLKIGALVSIRGVGRVKVIKFEQVSSH